MPLQLSRRQFLRASGTAGLALASSRLAAAAPALEDLPPLRETAAKKGILFGAAVFTRHLAAEPDFAAAVARECGLIVAEGECKWDAVYPSERGFTWWPANWLLRYANENSQRMRWHTLLWHQAFPVWAQEALEEGRGEELMENYIHTVMEKYKGRMTSWDVINEAIVPAESDGNILRSTYWRRALGDDYLEKVFRVAGAADPDAKLVYNDFGTEYIDNQGNEKRAAVLQFLRRLRDQNVPIHGFGMQSHIPAHKPIPHRELVSFCRSVKALGLDLYITELDVNEGPYKGLTLAQRDRRVAKATDIFLDCVFSVMKPPEVITWGLADRHTWRRWYHKDDALRPLPLDDGLKRKAMWRSLHKAFRAA